MIIAADLSESGETKEDIALCIVDALAKEAGIDYELADATTYVKYPMKEIGLDVPR